MDSLRAGVSVFLLGVGLPAAPALAGPLVIIAELGVDPHAALAAGVMAGSILFAAAAAIMFLRAARLKRAAEAQAKRQAELLSRERQSVQALVRAEPQLIVRWPDDEEPELFVSAFSGVQDFPDTVDGVLAFNDWLKPRYSKTLAEKASSLVEDGEAFQFDVETKSGCRMSACGEVAGGSAVMKLKMPHVQQSDNRASDQDRGLGLNRDISQSLFDALPMPVWFRDLDGRLNWVNKSYAQAVDVSDKSEVYEQQLEFLSSRQRDAARLKLEAGETYTGRIHAIVSGSRRAFEVVVQPVGAVSAGIAIDVAALETAESELSRHIEEHTRTLDNIATAVAIFSPDKKLDYFNQAYVDLWALDTAWLSSRPSDGEILDKLRRERTLPEEPDYKAWKQKRLSRYDETESHDERWHLPDGRTIHVIANYVAGGSATFLYENITEELDLKSRFNALIHVQKETLDHLREGVAVFGTDGRLKLFNPSFVSIWKLDQDALGKEPHIDQMIGWCRELLDDDAAWDSVKRAITGIDDSRDAIEGTLSRPDGSVLAYAGLPLPDGATLLTYIDITDSKRVENALIERNEALEAADQLKSAFISHVSYELRTPLTNIIGFSELLESEVPGKLTDHQREYLNDIQSSSGELLTIINDILDLATIDAGTFDLSMAPVKTSDVIESAAMGVREHMRQAGLNLEVTIDDDAQDIVADGRRLTQVMFNLLSNAAGFSEPGSTINVLCRRDGDMIAMSVEDKGRGIPEDYQESAFNPFETRPQGSDHRGTGLGLTIVKSLVELHGGKVTLASAPGVGTTVTVLVPVRAIPEPEARREESDEAAPAAAAVG